MNTKAPLGVRARPLDFYVAFLVFFFGIYGFFDPDWPERFEGWKYWVLMIEDIYLIISSIAIMTALLVKQFSRGNCIKKILIPSLIGEMFGWLFISAASWVIVLTAWVLPPSAIDLNGQESVVWTLLWLALAICAGMRYIDLRLLYRGHK